MKFMKKITLTLICILILFICQIKISDGETLKTNNSDFVFIKDKKIFLNIADTEEKKIKGLMYIDSISDNQGMVFIFKTPDYRTFWMKNMKIPLDIVFISNNKIATIYKEVPVCGKDPCQLYSSRHKIDSVIEFKNGFCDKNNIKIGDKIKFSENIKIKKAGLKEN